MGLIINDWVLYFYYKVYQIGFKIILFVYKFVTDFGVVISLKIETIFSKEDSENVSGFSQSCDFLSCSQTTFVFHMNIRR